MTPEFGMTQLETQPYLGIRATTTMDQLAAIMGTLFGEVYSFILKSGQAPAGMPFSIYHSMEGQTVELECGLPVASPLPGTDRIKAGELPAGTMATVTHFGPYEDLGKTWAALMDWIKSEGLEGAGAPWEVYATDPGAEPDQSKWRTDIFFPVCSSDGGGSGARIISKDCD